MTAENRPRYSAGKNRVTFLLIPSFLFLFFSFNIDNYGAPVDSAPFKKALEKGKSRYFKKISWDNYKKFNEGKAVSFIHEKYQNNLTALKALLGGFKNKDSRVRIAIYGEILYGGPSPDTLKNSRKGKKLLKRLRRLLNEEEKSSRGRFAFNNLREKYSWTVPEAVKMESWKIMARIPPVLFKKTNSAHYKTNTYLGMRMSESPHTAEKIFLLCLKAASWKKGNRETRLLILKELEYATYYLNNSGLKKIKKYFRSSFRPPKDPELLEYFKKIQTTLER